MFLDKLLATTTGLYLALLCNISTTFAQPPSVEKMKSALQGRMDVSQIKGVAMTPLSGLYEVNIGSEIIYTDANARYIIQGHLLDLDKGANLTEMRLAELNRVNFSDFPLGQTIVSKRGAGKRQLVIFADPNCGYCKRLEKDLQSVGDLTVYTFLLPILSADSNNKSRQIWCSADRNKVWQNWVLQNTQPTGNGQCKTPIESNLALAQKLGVKATPTLFFTDGSRVPGALPGDAIERKLNEIYK